MTLEEKQKIAATARTLICLLQECDDEDFVELTLSCVNDADPYPLETHWL